jgi:hypothetical protein
LFSSTEKVFFSPPFFSPKLGIFCFVALAELCFIRKAKTRFGLKEVREKQKHINIMKKVIYLFLLLATVLQGNAQRGLAIHGGYSMPTSNIKPDAGPFLFLKDAKSVGLDYSFGFKNKASGFKFSADYIMASIDKDVVASYAKTMDIPYKTFNFTQPKPTGISVMAGPNIALFAKSTKKRLPLMWLDLQAGAVYSKDQSLEFSQIQGKVSKEIKPSPWNIAYAPSLVVNVIKTNKIFINAKVGYSNVGGFTFGLGIVAQDCMNVACYRCRGTGCLTPPTPDPPKGTKGGKGKYTQDF